MRLLAGFLAGVILLATPAVSDEPPPFPDFTFKRVKPPSPGTQKFITVQIEPKSEEAAEAKPEASTESLAMAWFWNDISPKLSDAAGDRLADALKHLGNAPSGNGIATPRLSSLQKIANAHGTEILKQTVGKDVSPALVLAVISVESSGRADAVSHAGAAGLMQLMPATATRFGVTDRMAADQNIKGGVAYLDWLLNRFENDPILALAGYNAGENAVLRNDGVPPFNETRAYVPKVLAAWAVARGLCMTPPEFVTDPCVLRITESG